MAGRTSYLLNGENVAKARLAILDDRERPLSQQELANRVGIHRVTLAKIESGDARVSLEVLERLAAELGKSREHLLGEPEQIDEFERARERMADALDSFSEAVDLLQRRIRAHDGEKAPA